MSKRFLITVITILAVGMVAAIAIFLAKGYTFSAKEKRIVGTGIITISSEPDSASVFIDGHLTTATNATISSLPPKNYSVRIVKEGFIPWEKQIGVKEELVTEVKVTLFPAIPTIYPLTFNGVKNPTLSSDGGKLAFVVPTSAGKKAGIWVWTQTSNQPISFARSAEPHQIAQNTIADFSESTLKWSADSKQVLATVDNNNYLLEADRLNNDPRDITPILESTLKSWEEDARSKDEVRILAIRDATLRQTASSSAIIRWSPDETKFIVRKEPFLDKNKGQPVSDLRVYDLEDKKEYPLPAASAHIWLPDSRHIILVEDETISIVDFDGTNKAIIYAGSFQDGFVFPWLDSSRLVIISSFPTPTASEPNLYGINLK
ncbi:hypothetical protein A2867_03775 [Candidatus Daviesbacteria bacterium RIFCSPHIGHO2_01_FULL_40_11]|uniref:PEGA domain-containing protein n=1 Tax=Candidatus Daviesbacteria bacterium RIFCSPHIGHO2_01_FULL_40_11 TaxID=1797762 RepID=A0A1F5JG11_9BACT|nr:MAG: hypothetical protein A2867_03775 [Candidatus Daviesbacteria bacterium RIFCSPHIGHO2_01_FULL_40_11]